MNTDYHIKYLKYKKKYLDLKQSINQVGGVSAIGVVDKFAEIYNEERKANMNLTRREFRKNNKVIERMNKWWKGVLMKPWDGDWSSAGWFKESIETQKDFLKMMEKDLVQDPKSKVRTHLYLTFQMFANAADAEPGRMQEPMEPLDVVYRPPNGWPHMHKLHLEKDHEKTHTYDEDDHYIAYAAAWRKQYKWSAGGHGDGPVWKGDPVVPKGHPSCCGEFGGKYIRIANEDKDYKPVNLYGK